MPDDFVASFADAWDGRGVRVFTPPVDHQALLALAHLPPDLARGTWRQLTGAEREKLLFAARRAVDLGRLCSSVLGQGI